MTAVAQLRALTNTIGVVTTVSRNDFNQYWLEVFNGAIDAAAHAGRDTVVFTLKNWHEDAQRLPALCAGRVDALLLLAPNAGARPAAPLPAGLPIASVHANRPLPGVINLEADEEAGAAAMVRHMLRLGHRRILHVAGPEGYLGSERRLAGYLKAHAAARVKPQPEYIVHSDFTVESGREVMRDWLQAHKRQALPEAIFAASDAIAIGCIDTLSRHSLRIPEDISVVGFDDTALARAARLATVRQPLHEMGRRAVELLMAQINGTATAAPQNIVFPTEIVLSQSFSTPRATSLVIH
jgi:DNA-binding LacI/PurR family transcriptional regulator